MSRSRFPSEAVTQRLFSAAIAALVAFTALALIPGNTPPAAAAQDGSYTFTFMHTDGAKTTISDSFSGSWNVFIPNAGGNSASAPTGMTVHMSCSDAFVNGWGSDGGPVEGVDTEWRVFAYYIVKAQGDPCGVPPTTTSTTTTVPETTTTTTVPETTTTTTVPETTTTTTVPETTTTTTVPLVPGIDIEKSTNGENAVPEDADDPTGPSITIGDPVTWTYVVTNTGDVALSNITVTDDKGVVPVYQSGDTGDDQILGVGEIWIYKALGLAVLGQYANVGTVSGSGGDTTVTDTDPSHYFGQAVAASGTIGDTVWSDENDNGKQDNGEKGIAGATVRLTLPDNTTIQMNTNANGLYLFSGLAAGTYKSELLMSSIPDPAEGSLKLTTAGSFTIQLAEAESYLDADFGVVATLPKTGMSTDVLTLIALALLAIGGLAVLSTRRWREDQGQGDTAN